MINKKLKHLRIDKEWTQKRAAEKCGIPYQTFKNIESGVNFGRRITLKKIAKGFGVGLKDIIAECPFCGNKL